MSERWKDCDQETQWNKFKRIYTDNKMRKQSTADEGQYDGEVRKRQTIIQCKKNRANWVIS